MSPLHSSSGGPPQLRLRVTLGVVRPTRNISLTIITRPVHQGSPPHTPRPLHTEYSNYFVLRGQDIIDLEKFFNLYFFNFDFLNLRKWMLPGVGRAGQSGSPLSPGRRFVYSNIHH